MDFTAASAGEWAVPDEDYHPTDTEPDGIDVSRWLDSPTATNDQDPPIAVRNDATAADRVVPRSPVGHNAAQGAEPNPADAAPDGESKAPALETVDVWQDARTADEAGDEWAAQADEPAPHLLPIVRARYNALNPTPRMLLWALTSRHDDHAAALDRVAWWVGVRATDVSVPLDAALHALFRDTQTELADAYRQFRGAVASGKLLLDAPTVGVAAAQAQFDRMSTAMKRHLSDLARLTGPGMNFSKSVQAVSDRNAKTKQPVKRIIGLGLALLYPNQSTADHRMSSFHAAVARGELRLLAAPAGALAASAPPPGSKSEKNAESTEERAEWTKAIENSRARWRAMSPTDRDKVVTFAELDKGRQQGGLPLGMPRGLVRELPRLFKFLFPALPDDHRLDAFRRAVKTRRLELGPR